MKYMVLTLSALCLTVVLAACGGQPEPAAPAAAPKTTAPAPEKPATAAPAGETAAATASSVPATPLTADELHTALVGTSWMLGDVYVEFKDKERVFVKGGPLATLVPGGVDATYTLKEGVLEATVMGQTKVGSWDGEKLVIDGEVCVPQ